MNTLKKWILVVAVAACAVSAMGQGRGGWMRGGAGAMMGPSGLLSRDDVKDELNLSIEQRGKIADAMKAAGDRRREAFMALGIDFRNMTAEDRAKIAKMMMDQNAATEKEVYAVLTVEQTRRLRELFVQQNGNMVATNAAFAKELGLTAEQQAKIQDLQTKAMTAMQELGQKVRDGEMDPTAMQDAMLKNMAIMKDEIGKILTDEQRAKIKEWAGTKPFTFKETGR